MKVRDVMSRRIIKARPGETITAVASRMRENRVGSVLIVENGKLKGIITDRILGLKLALENIKANEKKAADIMHCDVVSVAPDEELDKAARLLEELEIKYLPVVESGKLLGLLSLADIADYVREFVEFIFLELGSREKKQLH